MDKRVLWVDYAKVIGIYLVVLGHGREMVITNFIYSFHMPLFFMLSGYLFTDNKYPNYRYFLKKKTQQLLLPYFAFNVITFILWLVFSKDPANKGFGNIVSYRPVAGMFYGNGIDDYLIHAQSLWFIVCLFTIENIYYAFFINKPLVKKLVLIVIFAILGYVDYALQLPRLPWGLNIAISLVTFYAFGNALKPRINRFMQQKPLIILTCMAVCGAVLYTVSVYNGRVDVNQRMYGNNYLLYFVGGIAGSFMLLALAKVASAAFGHRNWLTFIARNTIPIIAFNFLAHHIILRILTKLPASVYNSIKPGIEAGNVPLYIGISIIVFIMLLPVMYLSERYFPLLLGRRKPAPAPNEVATV
jgi:acyltransferase